MRKRTWGIIGGIIVIIGVVLFLYLKTQPNSVFSGGVKEEKIIVIKPKTIENNVTLSSFVDAEKKTTLRFQASGKLAWVGVKEGDSVKAGQVIATLDQRELQKRLERSLKDFMVSRWDFDQSRDDNKNAYTGSWNQYTSDRISRIVQQEQFGLDKSVIDVELATLNKELSVLVSPFAGIVTRVEELFPGVNITPAQAEFDIIDPSTVYLSTTADQQDVLYLKTGMGVEIIFDALPDKSYQGKITYISYSPIPGEEHSYKLKVSLPENVHDMLRLGMSADAIVTTQKKHSVISVPPEALKEENGKTYVTVKENGNKIKRFVSIGLNTADDIEITKGLSVNDVVIVSP